MSSRTIKSTMTPLWVISLFLSLTEIVAGITVTQADGAVQIALTVFVIVFPLLVATAFFGILWNRPYVFYPPTEFGAETSVDKFVVAMQRRGKTEGEVLELVRNTVDSSIRSPETLDALREIYGEPDKVEQNDRVSQIVDVVAERARNDFDEKVLTIDVSGVTHGENEILYRPFHAIQFVSDLLDGIYFEISDHVEPHTYDTVWILVDSDSGMEFSGIGSLWSDSKGDSRDFRSLREVGFRAGQKLRAIFK